MAKKKDKLSESNIEIKGNVSGTGNVVGNRSKSKVNMPASQPPATAQSRQRANPSTVLFLRVLAFVIGLAGTLGAIALFIRLLAGFDNQLIFWALLSGLVGVLGVMGALRPQAIEKLLEQLMNKQP